MKKRGATAKSRTADALTAAGLLVLMSSFAGGLCAEKAPDPELEKLRKAVRELREKIQREAPVRKPAPGGWTVPAEESDDKGNGGEKTAGETSGTLGIKKSTTGKKSAGAADAVAVRGGKTAGAKTSTALDKTVAAAVRDRRKMSARLRAALAELRAHPKWKRERRAAVLAAVTAAEPENAEAWYRLGLERLREAEQEGRSAFEAALSDMEKAAALAPKVARYHCDAGLTALRLGWTAKALDSCGRAVALAPTSPRCRSALGDALMRAGAVGRAVRCYSLAVTAAPKNPFYLHNLGRARLVNGDYIRAVQIFTEVLRLRPKDVSALLDRGVALCRAKKKREALADFRRALQLAPRNPHVHYLLGTFYSDTTDPTFTDRFRSVEHAQRAVKLTKGKDARYLMGLAEAYFSARMYEKAVKTGHRAVRLAPRADYRARLAEMEAKQRGGFIPGRP